MDNKELSVKEYREKIQEQYEVHNITHEKSELYYDFFISLLNLIHKTYLGDEVVKTTKDVANHFTWCFNKVLDNFGHERIKFQSLRNPRYSHVWYFFYEAYYLSNLEDKYELLISYFTYLFDYTTVKTKKEIDSYVDFYKMLDQNLKKTN
jgi:hypothetical protein